MASTYIKIPPATGVSPGSVDSFNGRTGVVVSVAGDYSGALVSNTPAGNITATNVQAAINELDTEKQAVITGAATTITSSNLTASRTLVSDGSGKVAVSAVTSTTLAFLDATSSVQTQLNTLFSLKQPLDAELTAIAALATNGLIAKTGAGTVATRTITGTASNISVTNGDGISGNPTIDLPNTAATPGSYTNPNVTVDAKGRITSISSATAATFDPDTSWEVYTDFTAAVTTNTGSTIRVQAVGTGAAVTVSTQGVNSTERCIGVFNFQSGTAANARTQYETEATSLDNSGGWTYYNKVRTTIDAFATLTDQYAYYFGFADSSNSTATTGTDGAFFRYNGNGVSTTWDCVTSAGGVQTTTNSGVVITPLIYQTFEITLTGSSAVFVINGVTVATISTNIPGSGQLFGIEGKIIKIGAGTGVETNAYIDYIRATGSLVGGR